MILSLIPSTFVKVRSKRDRLRSYSLFTVSTRRQIDGRDQTTTADRQLYY